MGLQEHRETQGCFGTIEMKKPGVKRQLICANGHTYVRQSNGNVCTKCEPDKKNMEGFLGLLSAPARRALIGAEMVSEELLAEKSIQEVLALHGVGKTTIPILKNALQKVGKNFRE
jgi:hypothetical protein